MTSPSLLSGRAVKQPHCIRLAYRQHPGCRSADHQPCDQPVLLLPRLADSLAGRMAILRLHPLAQCELAVHAPDFIDRLFDRGFKTRRYERLATGLAERICAGGYPAALKLPTSRRRTRWYADYLDAIVQRDARDLARIASLDVLPRLLALAAGQTARLLNVTDLAAPFQLSRPTIRDYVTLLARVFLLEELPPWHSNRLSRLVKTPKLHLGDSGLACALLYDGEASLGFGDGLYAVPIRALWEPA